MGEKSGMRTIIPSVDIARSMKREALVQRTGDGRVRVCIATPQ